MHKVQLDNQMLDAVQPVVLAPAVEYRPSGAMPSSAKDPSLVAFRWVGGGWCQGVAGYRTETEELRAATLMLSEACRQLLAEGTEPRALTPL